MLSQHSLGRRLVVLLTVMLVGAMVVAAFFHNEFRAQNWDPMQMRVYVDRQINVGGTFYENGLLNKGPFEPMVYRIAAAITSWDGFWYAISFLVIVVSGVLAWAASATVRTITGASTAGHRWLGVAVGIGVFFHFALGKADYAGVLYSRNMITGLLAGAWLIGLTARWWLPGRAVWAAALVGVLLGLAVQTLFVSGIAAVAVGMVSWSSISAIDDDRTFRRSRRTLITVPIAVFLAAPLYYAVRGTFAQFWESYWTYNEYQNAATGRSLANQLVYGRDVILRYYRSWPVSFVIVVLFGVLAAALWRSASRRERTIHAALVVWFVGAWTELVAGQRYSSHYFSILALPTALMAAVVVGHVYRFLCRERGEFRSVVAWPLAASMLAIAAGGGQHFTLGLEAASSYSSVHRTALDRTAIEPGKQRTVRAVLDLVSDANDPLLAWTEYPWTYLNYHRISATRWIWKSFMLGQIYLGRSSPDYVLPNTWEWFDDDVRTTNPAAFLEEVASPMTPGTPFATYVNGGFRTVFAGSDNNIWLRDDDADAVLIGGASTPMTPAFPAGASTKWAVHSGTASLPAGTPPSYTDVLQLSDSLCTRISGSYTLAHGDNGTFLSFRFDKPGATDDNMRLNVVDSQIFSGNDAAVFDTVQLGATDVGDEAPLPGSDTVQHDFAVVVGDQSAALVVDGMIRAAVRLTDQTRLSLEVRQGGVQLTNLAHESAPTGGGCPP